MMQKNNLLKDTNKTTRGLLWALLAAMFVAAILTAYLTFISVRDFVTSWELTNLPGITIKQSTPTPITAAAIAANPQLLLQPVGGPTPAPWDGASRVSLLMMGLDYRDWQAGVGAPRTDTMILLTIDPLSRTAGILSIPRDMWVVIPGFQYGKINTAYSLGEANKLPGGGPEEALKTVEGLLGVKIDYYAQIDFSAFVHFIDDIGGVKVNVPALITVDPLGDNNTKKIKPGVQVLNGELALAYARARHTEGGDFDRAQRQQQVIMAIRDRILNVNMMPTLISKAPLFYQELSSGIHTNLSLDQAIKLAWLAQQIPTDKIKSAIIGPQQVNFVKTPDGLDALKPLPDQIRLIRDEVFTDTGPASPVATNMSAADLMATEAARITVMNGSSTNGLAARTTDYLKSQKVNVLSTGNADQIYDNTTIIDYTGKPYTVKFLVDLMGISASRIYNRYDPNSQVDVAIIVGTDWGAKNPMPPAP